jgi:predicted RNase H-like HicB family nuclease
MRCEMAKYAIVIEKAENNYSAYAPDILGCIATGRTIEEVRRTLAEALTYHLELMRQHGNPIPEPSTLTEYVEVP